MRSPRFASAAQRWPLIRDIRMQASWYLPHSPVPIRMRSTRVCRRFMKRTDGSTGRFRTCRSIRAISDRRVRADRPHQQPVRQGRRSLRYGYLLRIPVFRRECTKSLLTSSRRLQRSRVRLLRSRSWTSSVQNYLDRKEPMHFRKCQITDKEYEGGAVRNRCNSYLYRS